MPTTSENSKPEITCIYVNYRSAELLSRSLQSLFRYEPQIPFEVIIVNNDQSEEEAIRALGVQFGAHIETAFQNPGFGAAANIGAERAVGRLLFFVNPDTEWQTGFFEEAGDFFKNDTQLGALGVQLVSSEGVWEQHNAGSDLTPISLFSCADKRSCIEWLSGGALFVPKKVFQELGGFDERFFLYFEDMDFCLRLRKKGYRLKLFSQKQLIHLGGKSHADKRSQKKFYDQSFYWYTKKHWPLFPYVVLRVLHPVYRFFFPYGR